MSFEVSEMLLFCFQIQNFSIAYRDQTRVPAFAKWGPFWHDIYSRFNAKEFLSGRSSFVESENGPQSAQLSPQTSDAGRSGPEGTFVFVSLVLCVAREWRRRGLGGVMLERRLRCHRAMGTKLAVTLAVHPSVQRMLCTQGFEIAAEADPRAHLKACGLEWNERPDDPKSVKLMVLRL